MKINKALRNIIVLLLILICAVLIIGSRKAGYQLVNDEPHYNSWMGIPHDAGWINSADGSDYYCLGEGKLATGWKYLDKKAYYFYEETDTEKEIRKGAQAKDYITSGGIPISDKGYLEGDEALAVAYALDVLDRYGWDLESAFKYSSALRFIRNSEELYGFRIHKCAVQGFKYGEGNCLAWVGTFCAMAKVMGYDCRLVWGTLPYNGEQVPHGWAEIWEDDGIHVYDPRKHEGEDMSGFDERYGEKGSRKYNEESKHYMDW